MNKKKSYSLAAHDSRFGTEEQCRDFLLNLRWNGNPRCPACGNDNMNYYLASRKIYKCKGCYTQFSITQGAIFERSKIPLTKWFRAIYFFTTMKRGVSSCQMAKLLGVRQKTAWFLLHRLREALKDENDTILSGIVESDETHMGPQIDRDRRLQKAKKKHDEIQDEIHGLSEKRKRTLRGKPAKRGRKKGSTTAVLLLKKQEREAKGEKIPFERTTIIFGMMERGGRVIMKKIGTSKRDITKANIYPHLLKHVTYDSVLTTDQSPLYDKTMSLFDEHHTVNHKVGYVIHGVHTNNIENAWKHFDKVVDGTYFHLSNQHYERYLDENTYRWNRRKKPELVLFEDFAELLIGKRITYKKLVEKSKRKVAA